MLRMIDEGELCQTDFSKNRYLCVPTSLPAWHARSIHEAASVAGGSFILSASVHFAMGECLHVQIYVTKKQLRSLSTQLLVLGVPSQIIRRGETRQFGVYYVILL